MTRLAGRVGDRSSEQLRFAGQRSLDVRPVQLVEIRSQKLADVAATDLTRRESEELHVRAVGDAVAPIGVPIADHRRQRIQNRPEILLLARYLIGCAVAMGSRFGGLVILWRLVSHVCFVAA